MLKSATVKKPLTKCGKCKEKGKKWWWLIIHEEHRGRHLSLAVKNLKESSRSAINFNPPTLSCFCDVEGRACEGSGCPEHDPAGEAGSLALWSYLFVYLFLHFIKTSCSEAKHAVATLSGSKSHCNSFQWGKMLEDSHTAARRSAKMVQFGEEFMQSGKTSDCRDLWPLAAGCPLLPVFSSELGSWLDLWITILCYWLDLVCHWMLIAGQVY